MREEAIHSWAKKFIADDHAKTLWDSLSPEARERTRELYLNADSWREAEGGQRQVKINGEWGGENGTTMFHEFFRYLTEGKIDPKSIAGTEQANTTLRQEIARFFRRTSAFFRIAVARLRKKGVDERVVAEIDTLSTQCAQWATKLQDDASAHDPYISLHKQKSNAAKETEDHSVSGANAVGVVLRAKQDKSVARNTTCFQNALAVTTFSQYCTAAKHKPAHLRTATDVVLVIGLSLRSRQVQTFASI